MRQISNKKLMNVKGGISFSASLISAMARGINSILELGRSFGTAIRRLKNKNYCS